MEAIMQSALQQNALVQDVASVIKVYYKAKDATDSFFMGISKAAQGTFSGIDNKVKQSVSNLKDALGIRPPKIKMLTASIDDLEKKLTSLEKARKISVDVGAIKKTGAEIGKVKAEIAKAERKTAISPKGGSGGVMKNIAGAFSKAGWLGMAADGFMEIAKAAGDAEDKKLGIKRGPGNVVISKGLAQDPSKTINGQLNTISERVDGVMGQVGLAIQPFISQMLGGLVSLTGMIPSVLTALQPLFDVINSIPLGQIFNDLGASIQSVLQVLQPVLTELKPLLSTVFTVVLAIADKISQLVQKVMVRFGPVFVKVAEVISAVLGPALEMAGKLFGGLLDAVGWVVDKVGDFIDSIGNLFSTTDDGMKQVAETAADKEKAKKGVIEMIKVTTPGKTASYLRQVGRSQGKEVEAKVMVNMRKFAVDQDKQNHTTKNTDLLNATQKILEQQSVTDKPKTAHQPKKTFAGYGGTAAQEQSDAITDGGKKSVVINIGKFFDNMNLTAQTMQQGFDDFENRVENIFLRIVNSAG